MYDSVIYLVIITSRRPVGGWSEDNNVGSYPTSMSRTMMTEFINMSGTVFGSGICDERDNMNALIRWR